MKDEILKTAEDYLLDIRKAECFLEEKFGKGHFLRMKNEGIIPPVMHDIVNSEIKSFDFHGRGCGFRKKEYSFEIEFDLLSNSLGFTRWTLYLYVKSRLKAALSEDEISELIDYLCEKFNVRVEDKIYFQVL